MDKVKHFSSKTKLMIWFSTLKLLRNAMKGLSEKPVEINGKTLPYINRLEPNPHICKQYQKQY